MGHTYRAEMREARQRVSAVAAATIDTRWGRVEYVDQGDGVPVFLSHGVFGGHDNVRDQSLIARLVRAVVPDS
jgi:hypothetical protein